MSLIADALKAAQGQRGEGDRARATIARRIIAADLPPAALRGGMARTLTRGGEGAPRHLRIAAVLFGAVLVGAVTFVAVASPPAAAPPVGELAPGAAALVDPNRATVDPGVAAAAARQLGVPDHGSPAPPPLPAAFEEPAGGEEPSLAAGESRTPEQQPEPAPAAAQPLAAEPRAEPARGPGRFQLTVENRAVPTVDLAGEAVAAQRQGDPRRAIELFRAALRDGGEDAEILNRLGGAHQTLGELGEAREAFRRAIAARPGFAAPWSNLGVVLLAEQKPREAQLAFAEAVRLDPSNLGARVNLAILYQGQGLLAEARSLLQGVLRADGHHAEAHYAMGRLLEQEGDRLGAIRHYQLFLANGAAFPHLEGPVRDRVRHLSGDAGG